MPFPIQLTGPPTIVEDFLPHVIIPPSATPTNLRYSDQLTCWQPPVPAYATDYMEPWLTFDGTYIGLNFAAFLTLNLECQLTDNTTSNTGDYAAIMLLSPGDQANRVVAPACFNARKAISTWRGFLDPNVEAWRKEPWRVVPVIYSPAGTEIADTSHFSMSVAPMTTGFER